MPISRRSLFRLSHGLAAAAILPRRFLGSSAEARFGETEANRLFRLSRETFLPLVNSQFAVREGSETLAWLTLLSVEEIKLAAPSFIVPMAVAPPPSAPPPKLDTFAVRFWGTAESLPSATYIFEGGALEPFALFIVPSGNSSYTGIFNRFAGVPPRLNINLK
jgi:hypothetical protein